LIASAALLRRWGEGRAAAVLGLLAALYQCDLTLHVEASRVVGDWGPVSAGAWVVLFVVKLGLLARALGLTLSPGVWGSAALGALAVASGPQLAQSLAASHSESRSAYVAFPIFVAGAFALFVPRDVFSSVPLDVRARRCIQGVWVLWSGATLLHYLYWCEAYYLGPQLVSFSALWFVARAERESTIWVAVTLAALSSFDSPALILASAAAMLFIRAFRSRGERTRVEDHGPYRGVELTTEPAFVRAPKAMRARLCMGSLAFATLALHLEFAAPLTHVFDAIAIAVALMTARSERSVSGWALALAVFAQTPLGASLGGELRLASHAAPRAWGIASIAAGFVALFAGLGAARLKRRNRRLFEA
jgi:hypothetical protein